MVLTPHDMAPTGGLSEDWICHPLYLLQKWTFEVDVTAKKLGENPIYLQVAKLP